MKHHLTERALIEYLFKLASESRMKETAEHLQSCSKCRQYAEKLEKKFAALNLLRDEAEVSDDLIKKVMAQVEKPVPTRFISFRRPAWIGAAAAVLVIGLLLFVPWGGDQIQSKKVAKDLSGPAEKMKLGTEAETAPAKDLDGTIVAMKPPSAPSASEKITVKKLDSYLHRNEIGLRRRDKAVAGFAKEIISEEPPFAPASAIELVTLPRRDNVQITIYNSADLTLVRERRNLTLKKGWNWLQFMWANTLIDPTSLSLEPLEQKDKIDIQQLVFPARLRELGRWLIRSETEGRVPFEVTYFTSGLGWRAFYMGTLSKNEKKMDLSGYVRVANNSGEDYENAQTRLIVGKVHLLDEIAQLAKRQYPYNRPGVETRYFFDYSDRKHGKRADLLNGRAAVAGVLYKEASKLARKEIKKEGLSEYFLYTIEGTETIADKWGKRLMSFEAGDIDVNSLYKYDEQRWGKQAIRFISFANDEAHNLGETPIPNGNMKIYSQADEQGYLSYVGGANIKYIPVDEEVELNLGPARLVSVEPILMDFKTDNYLYDTKGNIAGWDEIRSWKMKITNTRRLPVDVEITRGFDTAYWALHYDGEGVSYEKHDAAHARFKAKIAPRTKREFTYTVTTYHGTRQEQVNQ